MFVLYDNVLKRYVNKQINGKWVYSSEGYEFDTAEEAEKIAENEFKQSWKSGDMVIKREE